MSTRTPRNTGPSSAASKKASSAKAPSESKSRPDWLGTSLLAAKTIAAGGEMLPFPYVKGAFEIAVIVLETVEDILNVIEPLQKKGHHGFHSHFKEMIKLSSTADQIAGYQKWIQTLRLNFVLTATIDTNFQVNKLTVMRSDVAIPQVAQSINNCPPPSKIFHGRQIILDKMQAYFNQDGGKQHIFLLHGLGGAGKTQITLKFIQESSHTTDTLDAALKNIAVTKNVGDTPQDALRWLAGQCNDWLVFFDNADDPKIDLNSYFPRCSHGNIVITSRNPGLCVHAGLHSPVSDMEEADAVELLLKSAAQETTLSNREIATEIVKALWYLPLAIIQAGAFVAKSGALNNYLALEKPGQSHDDYAWTVYTTWEISFKQLSPLAARLLQLCSFLHHQGISEKMFSNASTYRFKPTGPSKEELKKPWQFITQFLGPTGVWDCVRFMDVTTELRAYSLINFNMETGTFSIHPLVHSWSKSILADQQEYCYSTIAIIGMSIATMTREYLQLASLWLLPNVDALLQGGTHTTPDFNYEYGRVYYSSRRLQSAAELYNILLMKQREILGEDHPDTLLTMGDLGNTYCFLGELKKAKEFQFLVLEKRRTVLGEDHPNTLTTMGNLAITYKTLGQLKEAEKLEVVVLEKQRKILEEDHTDTLSTMGNLAVTYKHLGQLKMAEKLEVVVLEKRKKILGEDHPGTLRMMGNLASTYCEMSQLKEAEELAAVVLAKQQRILGEDHPDMLQTMGNLANIYHEMGQLKEAQELAVVVLEKRRKILGEDHPGTLRMMGNLANMYREMGQLKEAEELGIVVLEKRRKILGEHHSHTRAPDRPSKVTG
ncbi:hypothetical protein DFH07DRAFT_990867 [Mycena maculata]|uniref:DUF7779 domain-containing protein n=1 Tax=Mycena maculata TaxID=230809 RepID=A0AAD7MTI5_9AGAR|nr:hypothetical protein DFH07DRAFT_990867 [Mycena maculata]